MPSCYYYDEQRNHCNCYVNENLDELLAENAELQETLQRRTEQLNGMVEMWVERGVENAKLREERDMYRDLVGYMVHPDIPDQLAAENAKLRELCADMWRFTGTACKKYPRLFDPAAQGGQMVQLNAIDSFEQRMRELGVDV